MSNKGLCDSGGLKGFGLCKSVISKRNSVMNTVSIPIDFQYKPISHNTYYMPLLNVHFKGLKQSPPPLLIFISLWCFVFDCALPTCCTKDNIHNIRVQQTKLQLLTAAIHSINIIQRYYVFTVFSLLSDKMKMHVADIITMARVSCKVTGPYVYMSRCYCK